MSENQQKLLDCLLLLSEDEIEEQQLFEKLAIVCIKHYKISFVDMQDLDYDTACIVSSRYNRIVQDFFFDSINCTGYKKMIPKMIKLLTY
jgi:hypothetical protein